MNELRNVVAGVERTNAIFELLPTPFAEHSISKEMKRLKVQIASMVETQQIKGELSETGDETKGWLRCGS